MFLLIPALCGEALARPKIGLVLSGGGARGMAHIGVLKVLEDLRVPVDAIALTTGHVDSVRKRPLDPSYRDVADGIAVAFARRRTA